MSGRDEIERLIATHPDDRELAVVLHEYSQQSWEFIRQLPWWGPMLYGRNREAFLPLIERHANQWTLRGTKDLEEWKDAAEANGDSTLFRILLSTWLVEKFGWQEARDKWRELFEQAFRDAPDRGARRAVVQKYNLWYDLPDDFVATLYRVDPVVTGDYIRGRLEREQWIDESYQQTAKLAQDAGDDELYFFLYRWTFPKDRWTKDVLRLAAEVPDPQQLCEELERRQPRTPDGLDGDPDTFSKLLVRRGADVLPYLERYVGDIMAWNEQGWDVFARAAYDRGFFGLWSLIVRTKFRHASYPKEIERIIDSDLGDHHKVVRLSQIAGAQWGWAHWRRYLPLAEETAAKLYRAFPELARTMFAPHYLLSTTSLYLELARAAVAANDVAMMDLLVARAVMAHSGWGYRVDQLEHLNFYAEYLDGLGTDFTRRAVAILNLTEEPPHFGRKIRRRSHPVYRVLFDTSRYEGVLPHVRDLLEAPSSEVRELGLRFLCEAGDDGVNTAVSCLDHLSAYLLNESSRTARLDAFAALALAAQHSRVIADDVLFRARQALDLRRNQYPRNRLIELIGNVLHHWPQLRTPAEQPVIFGEAPAQEAQW